MKNFPIDKYRFYFDKARGAVIAVSTYAGKTVKGMAKLDPRDNYDEETGKMLAACRCNKKIARKRVDRARRKMYEAQLAVEDARKHYADMLVYFNDANYQYANAAEKLIILESQVKN